MKKIFKSKGFIITALSVLCISVLGTCWFVSHDKPSDFKPDGSSPSSAANDWTENEGNAADAYASGRSANQSEEYPKVVKSDEDQTIVDFTSPDPEKAESPPIPEGKSEVSNLGSPHTGQKDPAVKPSAQGTAQSNTPAPGSKNDKGQVYDPVFGWVTPSTVQQQTIDGEGDPDKMVGEMD